MPGPTVPRLPGCRCTDLCLCRARRVELLDAPRAWPDEDDAELYVPARGAA